MDQTLMEKVLGWSDKDEFGKIIEAIEAVPEEERDYELTGQLARALNNRGGEGDYERAVELLEATREEGEQDPNWHFRLGYSYYYMDREWLALPEFERVLELTPDDGDAKEFVEMCERCLEYPQPSKTFCQRVEEFWNVFAGEEETVRQMMDNREDREQMEKAADFMNQLLHTAFEEIYFEMGFNGVKYDLILTAEGRKHRLFKLEYWKRHAPLKLQERWNFLVGRQASPAVDKFALQMGGVTLDCSEIVVWPEKLEGNQVGISIYSEALASLLKDNENAAYSMSGILLDQSIGEMSSILHVGWLDILDAPMDQEGIWLAELGQYIKSNIDSSEEPVNICQYFTSYQMKPSDLQQPWSLREDVFVGNTACIDIVRSYYGGDDSLMNEHQADGVVFGFFFYGNQKVERELMVPFRAEIEDEITANAEDFGEIIGGATGSVYSYIDFVSYDLVTFVKLAREILNKRDLDEIGFHVFRRNVGGVNLKKKK